MKRKLKKVYFADTETTQPNKDYGVRVYLWAIVGNGEVYTGESVDSLIRKMKKLKGIFYFHNLKFDFSYIHYYLLQNDIKCNILEKNGVIYSAKFFDVELRDSMNFLQSNYFETLKNVLISAGATYSADCMPYKLFRTLTPSVLKRQYLNTVFLERHITAVTCFRALPELLKTSICSM